MADVTAVLRELDQQFLAAVERGADLNELPVSDWKTFAKGFAQRNAVNFTKADTKRMRWMVAEKIVISCWAMGWELPYLIERAYLICPYDQVQKNLSLLSTLTRLEADAIIYLAAQQAVTTEAARDAVQAKAKRYWDDWDDYDYSGVRQPSQWDIKKVNSISDQITELITYLTLFGTEAETGNDPHGYAQVVADALPIIQEFQTYYPTFCALLNDNNVLNLTEKVIVKDPVELKITLPTTETAEAQMSANSVTARQLVTVKTNRAADEFQGFGVFIVLEPRAEDDRDLHGNYISAEEVEKACLHWSINHQRIDVGHDASNEADAFTHPDFRLVWNWMEYGEPVIGGYKVRPGTWMQAYQAMSEEGKAMFQNHEINALSPAGDCTFWRDPKPEA